jgi:hypothetical protein
MFEIKKELLEAMLNYLANKPYIEVFQLVNALQNLKESEQKDGTTKNNKD